MPNTLETSQIGPKPFKILLPLQLGPEEEPFLKGLPHLFRTLTQKAEITFFHALSSSDLPKKLAAGETFQSYIQKQIQKARSALETLATDLQKQLPAHHFSLYTESEAIANPSEPIIEFIKANGIDLLVLHYKQRSRWEGWLKKTVFWDLFEEAPTHVLAISQPLSFPPKRFLWITEMDQSEYKYLPAILQFIRLYKGTLYCAKINTPSAFYTYRESQRRILALCDHIVEAVDPDFVPQECLAYADKDLVHGAQHVMEDFLMDVLILTPEEELDAHGVNRLLQSGNFPILRLQTA